MRKSSAKSKVLSQLLNIYAATLRVSQITRTRQQAASALFLPPAAPGSLGDEAMLVAGMKSLANQDVRQLGIIAFNSVEECKHLDLVTDTINLRDYFAGTSMSWKAQLRFVRMVSRYDYFYCLGADMMDGFYSDTSTLRRITLVAMAAKTGANAAILGFSFNEQPTPASVKYLSELPASVRLCCRDPISHKRLTHYLKRSVELVADVAFLLEPAKDSKLAAGVTKWTRYQQAAGQTVIGVNANFLTFQDRTNVNTDDFVRLYVDALVELFSEDQTLSFLMIPHDFRGKNSDVSLAKAILEALPSIMKPYCIQVPTPCSAAEIKSICADLDLVLTGRMHLAIACLGQGTPVVGIRYQGKFEGLFSHFELQGMTIDPEKAFQPGYLASFLAAIIPKRKDIREHIQSKLAKVQALASSNFFKRG